jgi:hypothetical protein
MALNLLRRARPGIAVAVVLIMAFGPAVTTPVLAQGGGGGVRGFLMQDDQVTRITGAKVTVIDVRTGERHSSNITGDNGAYEITGLPAGTYDLGIEIGGAVYVTDSLVEVGEGQMVTLSFTLQPKEPNRKLAGTTATPQGTAAALTYDSTAGGAAAAAAAGGAAAGSTPWYATWWGITIETLAAAGFLYWAFDDDEDDNRSASQP